MPSMTLEENGSTLKCRVPHKIMILINYNCERNSYIMIEIQMLLLLRAPTAIQ